MSFIVEAVQKTGMCPLDEVGEYCMSEVTAQQATESAWRIHEALMDWTGKVDAKAAVVLSLESAVVTALAALSAGRTVWTAGRSPTAALVFCYWMGVGLVVLSMSISVVVVLPRLDGCTAGRRWRGGYVYFGHLRHWEAADLADALRAGEVLPVLARQLVTVSHICWRKHRLVQVSIVLACGGTVLSTVSCLIA